MRFPFSLDTCKIYRPPRCTHCSACDNCVRRFDHHYILFPLDRQNSEKKTCSAHSMIVLFPLTTYARFVCLSIESRPWTGTCIGERNYRYFYAFLVFAALTCLFAMACSIILIAVATGNEKDDGKSSGIAFANAILSYPVTYPFPRLPPLPPLRLCLNLYFHVKAFILD